MKTEDAVREPLVIFAIYAYPTDFPGSFVCRRWFIFPGEENPQVEMQPYYIGQTLNAVREHIPAGMACLARCEGDDPKIVETWL